jgi:hypothetical protein
MTRNQVEAIIAACNGQAVQVFLTSGSVLMGMPGLIGQEIFQLERPSANALRVWVEMDSIVAIQLVGQKTAGGIMDIASDVAD